MTIALELNGVAKSFTMHLQGGIRLPAVSDVAISVRAGQCAVLDGPSGAGKSSILKMIFGSYRCDRGQILVRYGSQCTDIATAPPRRILALRQSVIGYVSQFLRAIPRVATRDVVADPLVARGTPRESARLQAEDLLKRLNIASALWGLPPATFSGGEQQRVNIARGFLPDFPVLLLDEPTASLDQANSEVVMELIAERKKHGTAIVAVVHDPKVRDRIADDIIDITRFAGAA